MEERGEDTDEEFQIDRKRISVGREREKDKKLIQRMFIRNRMKNSVEKSTTNIISTLLWAQ